MRKTTIKEIIVPIENYPTVSEDADVFEAIMALEKAQKEFDQSRYKHRAILVYDKAGNIVGKVSQWDLIKSLEPKYEQFGNIKTAALSGLSPLILKSMMEGYNLWQDDLDFLCNRISGKKVKDIMYTPTDGEKVEENTTLGEAFHAFVIGHHQSLLVMKGKKIVGILRLTDLFMLLCEKIKVCKV